MVTNKQMPLVQGANSEENPRVRCLPGDTSDAGALMTKVVVKPSEAVPSVEPMPVAMSHMVAAPHRAISKAVVFPLCDAAVRNLTGDEWKLADAIVAECSEPGEDGVRNGSQAAMEAMRQEIAKNHGVDLSLERIRKLRKVASAYPPGRRRPGVSVEAHLQAGTPDTLDQLVKAAPAGTAFTRAKVRELMDPPNKAAENMAQIKERRRQVEDQRKALQDICRKFEQDNEELRHRLTHSSRSADKEPEPLSPPLAPEAAPSPAVAVDLERGLRALLLSRGIDPTVFKQAIADFIEAVLVQQQ